MSSKKVFFFIGTTAELIKLSPIIRELKKRRISFKIISSGQSKIHFKDLSGYFGRIEPDICFKEKSLKPSIFHFLTWACKTLIYSPFKLHKEFHNLNKNNTYFIVHGDTVSSLIGSLIAKTNGLKLVHIESGLRSFNFFEPFPEEICRYIIIHLADILFAPTEWAFNNLKGLSGKKVCTGENTLIEPCLWAIKKAKTQTVIPKLSKYYILTMHRQEHVLFKKQWTKEIMKFVIENSNPSLDCILVTNHLTTSFFKNFNPEKSKKRVVKMYPRFSYLEFMHLMRNAQYIATDGCTNQEEAYYMGLPLLALRNVTERIEGLNKNVFISKNNNQNIKKFLLNYKKYNQKLVNCKDRPSKMIVDYLFPRNN